MMTSPLSILFYLAYFASVQAQPTNTDTNSSALLMTLGFCLLGLSLLPILYFIMRGCINLFSYLDYDDPRNFEGWSEEELQSYELAKTFEQAYPPNSIHTDISPEQRLLIQEKGVFAWTFMADLDLNVMVTDHTELSFHGGDNCIQTNLPIPRQQPIYYFEVKLFDLPVSTKVAVGVATKPYPCWRFPGMNKNSIGYYSDTGKVRHNDPFSGFDFGPTFTEGDVIGCGYRPRSGTIFFTKNGVKIKDAASGVKTNLFPTIGSDGPCTLHVNLGQMGFVYIEANVGKWGLAPCEGSLLPPPAYGHVRDSILLEAGLSGASQPSSTEQAQKPPAYPAQSHVTIDVISPPPSYLVGSIESESESENAPLLGDYDSDS